MDIQLQKEYIDITELLEREIDKYDNKLLENLIFSLSGGDLELDNNDCEESEDIQRALTIFSLSFTVLRVLMNCRLISEGICEYQDQISKDWSYVKI